MDEQTRKLLEECCSGCRMAVDSFSQVQEYVKDSQLRQLISDYTEKHRQLEEKAATLLKKSGNEEKAPGIMASTMAHVTTDVKLSFNSSNTQIAKLLIDGCTMGIKTLGEKSNQFAQAEKEACSLASEIIKTEEDLMKKLKKYL